MLLVVLRAADGRGLAALVKGNWLLFVLVLFYLSYNIFYFRNILFWKLF